MDKNPCDYYNILQNKHISAQWLIITKKNNKSYFCEF